MATETVGQGPTDDGYADKLFEQVMTCAPALPPEQMEGVANLVMNQEVVGRQWRLTAFLASKGGEFYRELADDAAKAEVIVPAADLMRDFAKLLRSVADLADCVAARVMVAGCNHERCNEWRGGEA